MELQSHVFAIKAFNKTGDILCEKRMSFWSGLSPKIKKPIYSVSIECEDKYKSTGKPELIKVIFRVIDENKKPVKGVMLKYSFYETRLWEGVDGEKITDEKGEVIADYYIREPGYIIIAAGADYENKDYKKRYGNIKFIEIK